MPQMTNLLCRILKFRKCSLISLYRAKVQPLSYSCTGYPSSKFLCDDLHWPNSILFLNNHVFIADGWNHRICVFDMSGKFVNSIIHGLLQQPHGLGVNKDGNLIISCWASHTIALFSTGGNYLQHFGGYGSSNGKFNHPTGLSIHPKKNDTFICDLNNHRVQIFNPVFDFVTSIEELHYLQDIKFSSSKVVILDKSDFCIHFYDLDHLSCLYPVYVNHCVCFFSADGKLLHKLGQKRNTPETLFPQKWSLCLRIMF